MASTGNGTSQFQRAGTTVAAPSSYSYTFWYKPIAAASGAAGTVTRNPVGIATVDFIFNTTFAWSYDNSLTIYKAATHRNSDGTFARCQILSTPAFGVWIHIGVTFDGSNLKIYYNGALENTVAALPQTLNNPTITTNAFDNANGFDNSPVALFTLWSSALTAAQVMELSRGVNPTTIQNGSILSNVPLNAASDETLGPNMVNSGCTFKATYFEPMVGGLALGGHMPVPIFYTEEMSGGIAFGGAGAVPGMVYNIPMSGGIAFGGQSMDSFLLTGNGAFSMREKRGSSEVKR